MYRTAVDNSFKDFMVIKPPGEISYFSFIYHAFKNSLKMYLSSFYSDYILYPPSAFV